jgi:hypothetical protein
MNGTVGFALMDHAQASTDFSVPVKPSNPSPLASQRRHFASDVKKLFQVDGVLVLLAMVVLVFLL